MTRPAEDDPVVGAALQLLPLPEHRAGFWADLEAMLEIEAALEPVPTAAPARQKARLH